MAAQGAHNPAPGMGRKNPRSGRLLRHADFEQVYKRGRRHFSTHMTVFYLRRAEGEGLRVGFTVGRALGGAVARNRMKRRLREAVRLSRPSPGPAADVVINPKKSLVTAPFAALLVEVGRAFEVITQKVAEKPNRGNEPLNREERKLQ
jgi:ribonuclease P protein component